MQHSGVGVTVLGVMMLLCCCNMVCGCVVCVLLYGNGCVWCVYGVVLRYCNEWCWVHCCFSATGDVLVCVVRCCELVTSCADVLVCVLCIRIVA